MPSTRASLGEEDAVASSMALEILHGALVLLGRCARLESAEIPAAAGLRPAGTLGPGAVATADRGCCGQHKSNTSPGRGGPTRG